MPSHVMEEAWTGTGASYGTAIIIIETYLRLTRTTGLLPPLVMPSNGCRLKMFNHHVVHQIYLQCLLDAIRS